MHATHEPQNRYAQWKAPDAKGHVVDDSVYMKHPEKAKTYAERAD